MESYYGNVVLVTGASSGIGKAVAEHLAGMGYKVYGTSRSADNGKVVYQGNGSNQGVKGFVKLVRLDVCDDSSAEQAVQYILDAESRIDILVNNAGFGLSGAIEETTSAEVYSQFNTNFFGMHRMCRQVLPVMRKQGKGLIINIGSVAGLFGIPYQSMYSASKYAVEAYTEALRMEVREFGIRAVVVEPGDTKTGFTEHRFFSKESKESAYKKSKGSIEKMMKDEQNGAGPEQIAKIVGKLTAGKNPPIRVTAGWMYKVFVFLKRILPARLAEFILSKMYS
jgi:short-subunit dehydrogenase